MSDDWHYADGDSTKGPVGIEDLRLLFEQQVIGPDTCVWHPTECTEWIEISFSPKLFRALKPAPPPPARRKSTMPPPPPARASGVPTIPASARSRSESIAAPAPSPGDRWEEKRTLDGVPYFFNAATEALSWEKPDSLKTAAERETDAGEMCWVRDTLTAWAPAQVVTRNDDGSITCRRGNGRVEQAVEPIWTFAPSELHRLEDDVVMLEHINEAQIAHVLRKRYEQRNIYTWVGASHTVLISINPFEQLPLYTPDVIAGHANPPPNRALPPHVFDIAHGAHRDMRFEGKDQAILISGESGAGKTEATKQCLSFLAEVAGSESCLEQKILQASPVLEAFGNAKTLRNNNSSRFGKWIEVHFDQRGTICGARIDNYLLEKSRVTRVADGERNYHVFYQLFASGSASGSPSDFAYLNQSASTSVRGMDDQAEHLDVLDAMRQLGFSQDDIDWALHTCEGILHLGNIPFSPVAMEGNTGSKPSSLESLQRAARLFKVDASKLEHAVTVRSIHIPGEGLTSIPLSPDAAADACAALAKATYGRMFDWLVQKINRSFAGAQGQFIGVLDIFGFEIFENNSFEQLCINYCNEKLQQHFNKHTFKEEEAVYRSEGVDFEHVPFVDNQPVLDLIERRPTGILPLVDEEIRMPKGSDETFMKKVDQRHATHPALVTDQKLKFKDPLFFTVHHYAGAVVYNAAGFLDKNRDALYTDLHDAMASSDEAIHRELFPPAGPGARRHRSLGGQFSKQLNALMSRLYETQPRYIRCIKPNASKKPQEYNAVMCIEQMRYSGVFEAVKIRKSGFPFRMTYRQFAFRYRSLSMQPDGSFTPLQSTSDKAIAQELLSSRREDFSRVQFGATMVMYRAQEHALLELARNLALERIVPKCQRVIRGHLAREMARRLRRSAGLLQEALDVGNDIDLLDRAISRTAEMLNTLQLLFDFQPRRLLEAKRLREQLQVWVDVTNQLEALKDKDAYTHYRSLAAAIITGSAILSVPHTDYVHKLYTESKARLDTCAAAKIDPAATQALHTLERDDLEAVAKEAREAAYTSRDVEEILALLDLPEADLVKRQLRKAIENEDPVRRINREIKLADMYLEANAWMFSLDRYSHLRHPSEFAGAKMLSFSRDKIAAGMLTFSAKPIPTSLTTLPPAQAKEACRIFRSIQGYMGERRLNYPAEIARELCEKGFLHRDLRAEMYCQLMKQLTANPRPASAERGWELMAAFVSTFLPPDDFESFLLVFLRSQGDGSGQRFVSQLHRLKYDGEPASAPGTGEIETICRTFTSGDPKRSRFSVVASGRARGPGPSSERRSDAVTGAGAGAGSGAAATTSDHRRAPPPPPPQPVSPAGAGERYLALFDFAATDDAMMSFKKNDVLMVLDKSHGDWWVAAAADGNEGFVPMNYLEPC